MTKPDPSPAPKAFDATLAELERLVDSMERGDLSLEQSLAAFEQGIRLSREAQAALTEAEQKVQLLLDEAGTIASFPAGADAAARGRGDDIA